MSDYLPQDVWTSILKRLPVKSLVKCTLVCKSWYSLIKNPSFITIHFNHTTNHLLFVKEYSANRERDIYTLRHDNQTLDPYLELECPFEIDTPYSTTRYCNGLLCLYQPHDIPVLWNPSIRKYLTLPEPRIGQISSFCIYGLGFDSSTDDYKVVRVVYFFSDDVKSHRTEAELYSLSGGAWRNIDASGPKCSMSHDHTSHVFMNGAIHWDGYYLPGVGQWQAEKPRNLIVSFNMIDEVFGEIMVPSICEFELGLSMAVFEGCISFAQHHLGHYKCSIWVLKEYGVVESWVRQFLIDVQFILTFCFRKDGDVLLETFEESDDESDEKAHYNLLSYDSKNGGIEDFGIRRNSLSFHVNSYVESLVLLQ